MGNLVARDVIFDYLHALEIDYLFGVPGTNEIPIIDGTNHDGPKTDGARLPSSEINYIPCLHENIALGAAMGYARMSGKPGVVMLHVTPGVGHALGNLFNAYKSHIPLLILCGQQHSKLVLQEPLLFSDTVRVAEQYTKWSYEVRVPEELPLVMQRALKLAITPPMGPVFLSIPWDYTIQPVKQYTPGSAQVTRISTDITGSPKALEKAAMLLRASVSNNVPPVIIVGDGVGAANAWNEVQSIAEKTGAFVFAEGLSSMMNYPPGDFHFMGELPSLQQEMQQAILHPAEGLDPHPVPAPPTEVVLLCGFNAQAQIVAYDYDKGPLIPTEIKHVIYVHNDPWEIGKNRYGEAAVLGDIKLSLEALTKLLPAQLAGTTQNTQRVKAIFEGRQQVFHAYVDQCVQRGDGSTSALVEQEETIDGVVVAKVLGEIQQEQRLDDLVLVNEAISDAGGFQRYLKYTHPTSYFCVEGGSLGYSMPASLGIKLAVRNKHLVVNVVGDGSALFYPHTWWTAYKFNLPILYLITNNREYKTLKIGLQEIGKLYNWHTSRAADYLDMHQPPLVDFQKIAASFDIEHSKIATRNQDTVKNALRNAIKYVLEKEKPYVLEIMTNPTLPDASTYASIKQFAPMEVAVL